MCPSPFLLSLTDLLLFYYITTIWQSNCLLEIAMGTHTTQCFNGCKEFMKQNWKCRLTLWWRLRSCLREVWALYIYHINSEKQFLSWLTNTVSVWQVGLSVGGGCPFSSGSPRTNSGSVWQPQRGHSFRLETRAVIITLPKWQCVWSFQSHLVTERRFPRPVFGSVKSFELWKYFIKGTISFNRNNFQWQPLSRIDKNDFPRNEVKNEFLLNCIELIWGNK